MLKPLAFVLVFCYATAVFSQYVPNLRRADISQHYFQKESRLLRSIFWKKTDWSILDMEWEIARKNILLHNNNFYPVDRIGGSPYLFAKFSQFIQKKIW
ncbi:MAG: hypothetical protein GC192_04885 [Bacteroidetes bacterium]|nr:hypothetical protein [Bacteroidota bacterium]